MKTNLIEQIEVSLTEEQQQLLKDAIKHGFWGDSSYEFLVDGKPETRMMYGYVTNDAKSGGHFEGRKISSMFRSIYRKLGIGGKDQPGIGEYVSHCSDWWGDGTGDMIFVREEAYEDIEEWAKH